MDLVTPMDKECMEAMKEAEKNFEEYGAMTHNDVVTFRKGFVAGWKAMHKEMKGW